MKASSPGKYHLVEKVGEGGMAEVYKAFDPDLEMTVAIKVLKASFARDPLVSSRFVEGICSQLTLRHGCSTSQSIQVGGRGL